jgi:hypothetical protein
MNQGAVTQVHDLFDVTRGWFLRIQQPSQLAERTVPARVTRLQSITLDAVHTLAHTGTMNPTDSREKTLIESGLSHAQARKLTLEFSDQGIGVECRPSRNIGWDVWAYRTRSSRSDSHVIAADD